MLKYAAGLAVGIALLGAATTPSEGQVSPDAGSRPEGTCWVSYGTPQAKQCRVKGWTVTKTTVINRRMWARTILGPCPTEDSRRCYWNAMTQGNGEGRSFIQLGHKGTFTVVKINRQWASPVGCCAGRNR